MNKKVILPGATIGILGGGQLGRMSALAARALGYRVVVVDPSPDCPAGPVADLLIVAPLREAGDLPRRLAPKVQVVTYEWENVSADLVAALAEHVPVAPGPRVLAVSRHRLREKETLTAAGVPVAPFRPVTSAAEFARALAELGAPAVLKTATEGYDGKGQAVIRTAVDADAAYAALAPLARELVLEQFVPFTLEISVLVARNAAGQETTFPVGENQHRRNILDTTVVPARVPEPVARHAEQLALQVARALDLIGLLAVEMFVLPDGRIYVNELAPRPHNSGHYTLDACFTSQFEQHVRAVCNLPLGATTLLTPAAMVNIMGEDWEAAGGTPDWAGALTDPLVKLHLYGKAEPRPGRKMGHLTAMGASVEEALQRAEAARQRLRRNTPVAAAAAVPVTAHRPHQDV